MSTEKLFLKFIEEISIEVNGEIAFTQIQKWLCRYESVFYDSIVLSCGKWNKWVKFNEKPFPCVCPVRQEDCIFIETYYELLKFSNIAQRENEFKEAVKFYYPIRDNQNAVFEWVKYYEELGNLLLGIEPLIKIVIQVEPYQTLQIKIDQKNYPNLWEFKEIFTTNYYSKEYEDY
ncbi:hypothetical protein [Leptobacterium sp. I13]|uniref:hypothetical protein n=1 Tax=Leptobacterium meishanense TaxID=3128904 RepID=UPI0030ED7DF9